MRVRGIRSRRSRNLYLPPLYRRTANGEIQRWRVWSEDDKIFTEFGLLDGKKQRTVGKRTETTNEGKKNERGPIAQAQFEVWAMWKHRIERKYRISLEQVEKSPVLFPMLALDFWKRNGKEKELSPPAKRLKFPVFVQKKFNGVRCMARWVRGKIVLFSRQGKVYDVRHITRELERYLPRQIALDGELYLHGLPLQKITSLVKDYREESEDLQYHVYDLVHFDHMGISQRERFDYLDKVIEGIEENTACARAVRDEGGDLVLCPDCRLRTIKVKRYRAASYYEIMNLEREFVEKGYEGAIIRSREGTYRLGARSPDLLKFKSFEDREFKVVGCREGKGKFEGCAIFICENDANRKTFKVTPRGSQEWRRELWERRSQYLGKKLTVRFKGRTDDEIPFHPVGIAFRDKKDLP